MQEYHELNIIHDYQRLLNNAESFRLKIDLEMKRGYGNCENWVLIIRATHPAYTEDNRLGEFTSVKEALAFVKGWGTSRSYLQFEKG